MRKTLAGVLSATALVFAAVTPAVAAPSENACNQGTMHAHATVPHGNPAHGHIPECGE
jgi:hypothetical protein